MLFLATGSRSACKHGRLGRLFAFSSATCCGSQFLSRALQTLSRAILRVNANLNAGEKCDYEGDEFLFLSLSLFVLCSLSLFLFSFPSFFFLFLFQRDHYITYRQGESKGDLFILARIFIYPRKNLFIPVVIYLFIYLYPRAIYQARSF